MGCGSNIIPLARLLLIFHVAVSTRNLAEISFSENMSTSRKVSYSVLNQRILRRHSPKLTRNTFKSHIYETLDPDCKFLSLWNRVFLVACLVALFIDPFIFFVPHVARPACIGINQDLLITVTVLRSLGDIFFCVNIIFKFRTAFVLSSCIVIGSGDLVKDSREIAKQYLKSDFMTDLGAAFPLPQIINWIIIPKVYMKAAYTSYTLALFALIQYVPRFFIIFPLTWRIIKYSGFVIKTASAGAAYNFVLYMLASHVIGASWYLLSIQQKFDCWSLECEKEGLGDSFCHGIYLDCKDLLTEAENIRQESWLKATHVLGNCEAKNKETRYKDGVFAQALGSPVFSLKFSKKYLYCLWWGLKNMSSYGQNLATSGSFLELAFSALICSVGVLLFCFLIANIQMYLQSMITRQDKWREKVKETKNWMVKRELPLDLQERIHKFGNFRWLVTSGIDEGAIVRSLPWDFRRVVQRHLCLHLLHHVHFFSRMDNHLLDALCERLISSLNIADTYVVLEGDPVEEMLFIIRGELKSSTTDGGRSGFFNSVVLGPGDYCGEELLTWALMPSGSYVLPFSTRTVRALSDVEAFALRANDLKYVANQFKCLHSKEIQHIFRFYSHQWRTWGACCIQAAWKRFKKKKLLQELQRSESLNYNLDQGNSTERDSVDARIKNTNKLATTYWAASTIQAAWRRYRNKKMWQLLEMCESFYYDPY